MRLQAHSREKNAIFFKFSGARCKKYDEFFKILTLKVFLFVSISPIYVTWIGSTGFDMLLKKAVELYEWLVVENKCSNQSMAHFLSPYSPDHPKQSSFMFGLFERTKKSK